MKIKVVCNKKTIATYNRPSDIEIKSNGTMKIHGRHFKKTDDCTGWSSRDGKQIAVLKIFVEEI